MFYSSYLLLSSQLQFCIFIARPPFTMAFSPVFWLYSLFQWLLDKIFSPIPPAPGARLRRPKVAVIGAGLTGVSSAAHIVGHGFDVTLFEAGDESSLGGIWSKGRAAHLLDHYE